MAKKKPSLNIPDAPHRPGDEASFESWPWQPGDLDMPDPEKSSYEETVPHAAGLIRVLGDDNKASGAWDPGLDADELREGLEHMVRLLSLIHI